MESLFGMPIIENDDLETPAIVLTDWSAYGPGLRIGGIFIPYPKGWKQYNRLRSVITWSDNDSPYEGKARFEGMAGFNELGHEIWEEIKP